MTAMPPLRSPARPAIVILGIALAVGLGAATGCASTAPQAWVLEATDARGVPIPGGVQSWSAPGARLEIRPLDDAARTAYLVQRAGAASDPFATSSRRFLAFQLTVAAGATLPVHIETQSIKLLANRGQVVESPLDYTRAYELLRPERGGSPADGAVESLMRGIFDGPIDLPPGRSIEGLLMFAEPKEMWDIVLLDLPFVQVGPDTSRFQFMFQKKYLDGDEKR